MKTNMSSFVEWLRKEKEALETLCQKHAEEAKQDLHHFMAWSDNAFEHAAKLKEVTFALNSIEKAVEENKTLEKFIEHWTKNVTESMRHLRRTTSMAGNYMDNCDLAARAQVLDEAKSFLHF